MLSRDGIEVAWPYCDRPGSTHTAKELLALIDKNTDAATKLVAHAHLTRAQIAFLYAATPRIYEWGLRRRMAGKRILQSGLLEFCAGIGEKRLIGLFGKEALRNDKRALRRALLAFS